MVPTLRECLVFYCIEEEGLSGVARPELSSVMSRSEKKSAVAADRSSVKEFGVVILVSARRYRRRRFPCVSSATR